MTLGWDNDTFEGIDGVEVRAIGRFGTFMLVGDAEVDVAKACCPSAVELGCKAEWALLVAASVLFAFLVM